MMEYNYFETFCLLSAIYVSVKVLSKCWWLINNYLLTRFRKEHDYKYYGQWAVVTGGSDGIGKGFAMELASKGLNICLISRTEEKLINTVQEIERRYGVKTKYIATDFENTNIYNQIRQSLTNMDIGILVNNVGYNLFDGLAPFVDRSEEYIMGNITVNIIPLTMMTHIVAPGMIAKKRGLIINLTSIGSDMPVPYFSVQCASKNYGATFGKCLSYELKKHNIQMTTLSVGLVETHSLRQLSFREWTKFFPGLKTSVENYVKSSLLSATTGTEKTCGYIVHEIFKIIYNIMPFGILGEATLFLQNRAKKHN